MSAWAQPHSRSLSSLIAFRVLPRSPRLPFPSYSLDATPVVGYVTPSSGPPGTPITIVGRSLAGTVLARFDRFGAPPGANPSYCSPDPAPAPAPGLAALACTVPDELTAGNYTITLIKPGGDESIDPYTVRWGNLLYTAKVASFSAN